MDHLLVSSIATRDSTNAMPAGSSRGQFYSLADGATCFVRNLIHHGIHTSVDNIDPLPDLALWLQELANEIERQKTYNLCKLLINKAERLETIGEYHRRLASLINNSQLPASAISTVSLSLNSWFDQAQQTDQAALDQHFAAFCGNKKVMAQELGFDGTNAVPIMARLQRYLNDGRGEGKEIYFMKAAISYLSLASLEDRVVEIKPWMITVFDVDIGPVIGTGSLGKVYRGRWKHRDVAIKMLKTKHDILPRSAHVDREMEKWSKLYHSNVLAFLGGNTLDNEPFIVLPFLNHQTSRDYIHRYPDCNRVRLLYETSLGLLYLHSENIIHGNLKGLNILIDDDDKPRLCDYGFAKIKADINSRSPLDPASSPCLGSRNWMAPELFKGGNLTFQSDIYSFGMTMYEILADDIPLGHASPSDLYSLVVRGIRPARPDNSDAPQFSDSAWTIAGNCWVHNPTSRINLPTLSDQLAALLPSSVVDGLENAAPSTHALPSIVHSTIISPQVSQPIGLE